MLLYTHQCCFVCMQFSILNTGISLQIIQNSKETTFKLRTSYNYYINKQRTIYDQEASETSILYLFMGAILCYPFLI